MLKPDDQTQPKESTIPANMTVTGIPEYCSEQEYLEYKKQLEEARNFDWHKLIASDPSKPPDEIIQNYFKSQIQETPEKEYFFALVASMPDELKTPAINDFFINEFFDSFVYQKIAKQKEKLKKSRETALQEIALQPKPLEPNPLISVYQGGPYFNLPYDRSYEILINKIFAMMRYSKPNLPFNDNLYSDRCIDAFKLLFATIVFMLSENRNLGNLNSFFALMYKKFRELHDAHILRSDDFHALAIKIFTGALKQIYSYVRSINSSNFAPFLSIIANLANSNSENSCEGEYTPIMKAVTWSFLRLQDFLIVIRIMIQKDQKNLQLRLYYLVKNYLKVIFLQGEIDSNCAAPFLQHLVMLEKHLFSIGLSIMADDEIKIFLAKSCAAQISSMYGERGDAVCRSILSLDCLKDKAQLVTDLLELVTKFYNSVQPKSFCSWLRFTKESPPESADVSHLETVKQLMDELTNTANLLNELGKCASNREFVGFL